MARNMTGSVSVQAVATSALLLLYIARSAHAHQFSIAQGTATVYSDRVAIVLEFNGEDLRHLDGQTPPTDATSLATWIEHAADRHGENIRHRLILRDSDGNTIQNADTETSLRSTNHESNTIESLRDVRITHRLIYPLSARTFLLTFQQSPDLSGLRSQWVLSVRSDGDVKERIVRLTSQGNTETLEFDWPSGEPPSNVEQTVPSELQRQPNAVQSNSNVPIEIRMRDEKYRTMYAVIRTGQHEMTMDLFAPLALVETFVTTSRRNPDYLEVDEQQSILAAWLELAVSRICVTQNGDRLRADLSASEFLLSHSYQFDADATKRRCSAYAVCTHIQWKIPKSAPVHSQPEDQISATRPNSSSEFQLNWELFNNILLNVPIFINNGTSTKNYELSTYSPRLSITTPSALGGQ